MKCYCAYFAAGVFLCLNLSAQVRKQAEEEDNQQAQRERWFYEQRRFPLGHIPTGARASAIEEIKRRAKPRDVATNLSNWTLIGPQPTGQGSNYPTAGRVNAIAIDPRNNNVVYIGAAEGGVWKTTDGGVTWIPLTDDQPSLATGSLLLDPHNPDTLYVGTGEENFTQDSYYGAGILKSTDGGVTWTNLVGPFLRAQIGSLALSPDSKTLLCTTELGIWRSTDGAVTWKQVLGASGSGVSAGTSVLFDPSNGAIAYAALGWLYGDTRNGVYRSSDGGQTWQPAGGSGSTALPDFNVGRVTLAVDPTSTSTIYAALQDATQGDSFGAVLGVWKSLDGANTWNRLSTFPSDFCNQQCWYDMAMTIDPRNSSVVYAGGLGVTRSMDGGATWEELPFAGLNKLYMHVDQHALAFTPDGTMLYIGNDGGMYSTTDVLNANVSFTELNDTLSITQFYPGVSVDPTNVNTVIGGTQDNGTQLFTGSNSWSNITCGDGGYTAIDPAFTSTFYAVCHDIEIERTDPSGYFFPAVYGIDQADRVEFIAPLAMDAADPAVLYFGTYRVWQTTDGAGLWSAISPDLTADKDDTIKAIAVAPSDSNVIYAGTEHGRVQVTTELNHPNWTNRTTGLPTRTVTRIVVDPVESKTAYVTFSGFAMGTDTQGHIFQTTNGGQAWTDISGDLPNIPVNDLVVDPDLPGTFYAGTDAGVMVTNDSGATWTSMGSGLPMVVVESLVLQRQGRVLRAATHGRSVWQMAVPLASASMQPTITSLTPNQANAGDGLTIKIAGTNFSAGTMVRWNGEAVPTMVRDASDLTVQVPANDIAVLGQAAVQAFTPSAGGGASNPMYFVVGPAPISSFRAFVNAANPTGGDVLAPGTIASLYGANFGSQTVVAGAAPPLPLTLGGVTVTLDKVPVPLYFVSPNQINFQVPYFNIERSMAFTLTVTQGSLSTTFQVGTNAYAPALFTTNSQGSGQASALIAGTASIPAAVGAFSGSRPAHAGEYVSLYCTGLGSVTNTPYLGYPAASDPTSMTIVMPTATIAGLSANVVFSGLAPGFVGLYQVNVQVPAGVAAGAAAPVALTIGGTTSNTATIAVE
jgi:uncharacterized protein (TIGR03437 family)